ncbi:ABC transporter substrate-binding protein [Halomonas salipaludis]|uniref:Spermidine/putrescine ABC transporter substrate-binding protein n=1 Tax=Halomonas salipaludis TaxID=2032625 RepID=A0A2A2ENZ4_9GAMM|nr:extracellular solute-binding protein [Halomonas salipaludis]PAU75171.1 spermidine/putrescine ABC transporter substrate-binding protein [Halomonas salipaludis]
MITPSYRLLTVTGALMLGATFAHADTLRVLNWQGYGTDERWAIEQFEQATGHRVVHEYFNSEQEMLTKLRTNPGAYDVIVINAAYTQQAAEEGLIQPIDLADIPNAESLDAELAGHPHLSLDGEVYGAAWVWGVTSFAINTQAISEPPNSLQVLWDPQYAGRIGWRDDAVESVQFAALLTGQDINAPDDFDEIRERLYALKPQIRTFWGSENEWNQYMASGEFDMATYWSGSAARSGGHFGLPIEFVTPREGAIAWLDGLSMQTDAPHPEAAREFIDWMIAPDFYTYWDGEVGAPISANVEAVAALPDGAFNKALMEDLEQVERLPFMGPIEETMRRQMLEVWQETKTYFQE